MDDAMNAGEPNTQILEIPGEPTLWRTTDLPPRRIELPCSGRYPQWKAWLILLTGGPVVVIGWIMAIYAVISGKLILDEEPSDVLQTLLTFIAFLPLLVLGSEAVFMTLRGMFHRGYHARFDADTFQHFQLSDPVAFRCINKIEIFHLVMPHGFTVPLALRITADQSIRLRFSSLFSRRRRPSAPAEPARFTFSPRSISLESTLLIDAISLLVKANGGLVVERRNFMYLLLDIFT
jgi:hypothetical protein